jgi:hypothetical protein
MAKVKPAPRRGARKASARGRSRRKTLETTQAAPAVSWPSDVAVEGQVMSSNLSLHELFEQQARQMIDRADLDEEQKQNILVAMSCPCCGAAGVSFTAKLRR